MEVGYNPLCKSQVDVKMLNLNSSNLWFVSIFLHS